MLSRVAESVYWMSRLVERAENVARFIGVNLNLSLDLPGSSGEGEQWHPLVVTSGDDDAFSQRFGVPTRRNVIRFLALDAENPNSVRSCLATARENARTVRECISEEMWEHLNQFHLMVAEACESRNGEGPVHEPQEFFEKVRQAGQQFLGVTDATMTHGEAWQFCRLGRSIERADKTTRILDVKYYLLLPEPEDVGTPFDSLQWAALLRSAGALQMYRQKHGRITPRDVVDFLVLDLQFPRSVLSCLAQADGALHAITGTPSGTFASAAEQRLGKLHAGLAFTRADEIVAGGMHEFLDSTQRQLNQTGDAVFETFFAPQIS
ncbi:alpha-E domain-containing protein [Alienimonas sp. DA493]|uniref:alpha-E domain-containing protein n=1 Tax=Alienimonas sp. DA493 TaxID=3373605 RepID=UPI003754445E